ncbi:MAG: PD-(D/E)XK nuclease-like domain-containing protein [Thermodesulfobacteriota bacterium]
MIEVNPLELWPARPDDIQGFCNGRIPGAGEYMSYSRMKHLIKSPGHYHQRYILDIQTEKTRDMRIGELIDLALLGTGEFRKNFVMEPQKERYKELLENKGGLLDTKAKIQAECRKLRILVEGTVADMEKRLLKHDNDVYSRRLWSSIWKKFQRGVSEETIVLKATEADTITAMVKALGEHPVAYKLLSKGHSQVHTYAWDKELGVLWYGILDYIRVLQDKKGDYHIWLSELKSTKNASPWGFPKEIDEYAYHIQIWVYVRMITLITGIRPRSIIVAVEKKVPVGITLNDLDDRTMETARDQVKDALEAYRTGKLTNKWPVYPEVIRKTGLPNYALYRIEENLTENLS